MAGPSAGGSSGSSGAAFVVALAEEQSKGQFTMLSIQAYASGTSTADNVASFIVPTNSKLVAITGELANTAAAGVYCRFEVSGQSTSQFTTNDARNIIAPLIVQSDGTAGFANVAVPVPGLTYKSGDKVYIHRALSAANTATACRLTFWFV